MLVDSAVKILAIIPARGGSKRLPRKNVLMLDELPLFLHSVRAAKSCSLISDIIVSSDDEEICKLAEQEGVIVINRPKELSRDNISNEYVVEHAIKAFMKEAYFPEYIVLLQPTSPLRNAKHLEEGLKLFLNSQKKSLISLCKIEHHPAKYMRLINEEVQPYTCLEDVEKQSQELEVLYRQNGAIYALKTEDFLQSLKFYQSPCLGYIMPLEFSVDVDTLEDLNFCEFLIERKNYAL